MIGYLLRHHHSDQQTLGTLHVFDDCDEVFQCYTLEPPWQNNENNVSCIPAGVYAVVRRSSPRYGDHWHVQDVDGRSLILIHFGNYRRNTEGCILPGRALTDIDGDGHRDVTSSEPTMRRLNALLPPAWTLRVIEG